MGPVSIKYEPGQPEHTVCDGGWHVLYVDWKGIIIIIIKRLTLTREGFAFPNRLEEVLLALQKIPPTERMSHKVI